MYVNRTTALGLFRGSMEAIGHSPPEAALIADCLARREDSLPYVLRVVARARENMIQWQPIDVLYDSARVVVLDGHEQMSCLVAHRAAHAAIAKAYANKPATVIAFTRWAWTGLYVTTHRLAEQGFHVLCTSAISPTAYLSGEKVALLGLAHPSQPARLLALDVSSSAGLQNHGEIEALCASSRDAVTCWSAVEKPVIAFTARRSKPDSREAELAFSEAWSLTPEVDRPPPGYSVEAPVYDALVEICGPRARRMIVAAAG